MSSRETPQLSVVMPCYNERPTVREILARVLAVPISKEIIVVDDGSTDGSAAAVEEIARREPAVRLIREPQNRGKGAAVRRGIQEARGEIVIVQDADLEYDPRQYPRMIEPILDGDADVVFGSRFEGYPRRVMFYWHTVGNRLLTWLSNLTTNLNLTDVMTGYKAFRREVIQSIRIDSDGFGFEPEITAKIAHRGYRLYEVPVSYHGREYWEGKKTRWSDGIRALLAIVRFRLFSRGNEVSGHVTLERMGKLDRYNEWIWDCIAPHLGERVLEVGAGIGNMTRMLYGRDLVVATDLELPYLHILRNRFSRNPNVRVERLDLNSDDTLRLRSYEFDTVVCLNVLEHVEDHAGALQRLYDVLVPGGKLLLWVPADQALFGTMDTQVGHVRRYSREDLRAVIEEAGFTADSIRYQNRFGRFGWWLNGRVLKRAHIPGGQSRLFEWLVPVLRRLESPDPPKGLSLVAIATKPRVAAQRSTTA